MIFCKINYILLGYEKRLIEIMATAIPLALDGGLR